MVDAATILILLIALAAVILAVVIHFKDKAETKAYWRDNPLEGDRW
jgi:FtsZ-interacting cell division protein ZipA